MIVLNHGAPRREEVAFNVVSFHGYAASKKGNRWQKLNRTWLVRYNAGGCLNIVQSMKEI